MKNLGSFVEECPTLTIGSIKPNLKHCRMKQANITGILNILHGNSDLSGSF